MKYQRNPSAQAGQNIGGTSNNHIDLRQFALRLGGFVLIAACVLFPAAPSQAGDPRNPYIRVGRGRSDLSKTLTWDGGPNHPYAEVWVAVDGGDETKIVEQGKGIRRVTVEPGKTYLYILSDANERLATVTYKAEQGTATPTSKPAATPGISAWVGRWTSNRGGEEFEITFQQYGGNRLRGTFKNPHNTGKFDGTLFGNVLSYRGDQTGGSAVNCEGTFTILDGGTIDGQGVTKSGAAERKYSWTAWKLAK